MSNDEKSIIQIEIEKELGDISFVELTKELLVSSIKSSDVKNGQPYTDETLQQSKLTLGYLNAFLKAYTIRMNYWTMVDVNKKIEAIKELTKRYGSIKEKEIYHYKCSDCKNEFESNLKKLDAVCLKCESIHIEKQEKKELDN